MEQNIYARIFIEEIESEKRWDSAFSSSEDILEQMADEALKEFKNNKTTALDQEELWSLMPTVLFGKAIVNSPRILTGEQKNNINFFHVTLIM